jgi:hypothetical protein
MLGLSSGAPMRRMVLEPVVTVASNKPDDEHWTRRSEELLKFMGDHIPVESKREQAVSGPSQRILLP